MELLTKFYLTIISVLVAINVLITNYNNTNNINFFKGDVSLIRNKNFDCILANINRNIILRDLVTYYKSLIKGGKLLISGFLVEDFDIVNKKINEIGFKLINKKNKNKWLMLHLEK